MKNLAAIILSVAIITGMYWVSPYRERALAERVSVVTPVLSNISDSVTLHGTLVEQAKKSIYPTCASQVEEVYVAEGQKVETGQLLMRLMPVSGQAGEAAAANGDLKRIQETLSTGDIEGTQSMLEDAIKTGAVLGQTEASAGAEEAYCLYSPMDGTVMKLSATVGEYVSGIFPCMTVSDLSQLAVSAGVGEDTISKLKENMDCIISVSAFHADNLTGQIETILPYAQQTGVFTGNSAIETEVLIALQTRCTSLRPGYSASVKVITDRKDQVILLPYNAVGQDEDGKEYVMKLVAGRAVRQSVQTGYELDDRVEVTAGVVLEDVIIVMPDRIKEGSMVVVEDH